MNAINDELPREFRLEKYFDKHGVTDFSSLANSDVQPLKLQELLALADDECRALWEDMSLSYTYPTGDPLLRREAAKFHSVTEDEVMICTGHEGIYIAFKCLTTKLKRQHNLTRLGVVVTYPAFQSLYELALSFNCDVRPWYVRRDDEHGWRFLLDDLKEVVNDETRILVVNFPHNPTGFVPSAKEWNQIVDFCRERDIFLFSDEMYRLTDNIGTKSLTSACAVYDNALTIFGMSKTFACPGLRIAWVSTRCKELMKMMVSLKDYVTICPSRTNEILALIALRNQDKLRMRTLSIINENLTLLDNFFKKHSDIFTWHRPRAGTTGFVKLKGWALEINGGGAYEFCEKLVEDKGILLLPSKLYYFRDSYVRIGFGYQNVKEIIDHLTTFLEENKKFIFE